MSENNIISTTLKSENNNFPSKKQRLDNILSFPSLMGFGTFMVENPEVIINALKTGYRHLDLAENYKNLANVKSALEKAFSSVQDGGLGLSRDIIWLTMKVAKLNDTTDHVDSLLNAVGTIYFDLLLYHYPFEIFDTENDAEHSWRLFCDLPTSKVRQIGVSNFYVPHMLRLLDICHLKSLRKPFANEILINPYTFGGDVDIIQLCKENEVLLMAYSPLGFYYSSILLEDERIVSFSEKFDITPAQIILTWLMSKNICVIPKTNDPIRQSENYQSLEILGQIDVDFKEEIRISLDSCKNDDEFFMINTALNSKTHGCSLLWKVDNHAIPPYNG